MNQQDVIILVITLVQGLVQQRVKADAMIVVVDHVEAGALKRVMGAVKKAVLGVVKTFARTLHLARLPTNHLPITINQVATIALEDVKTVVVLDAEIHVPVVAVTIV